MIQSFLVGLGTGLSLIVAIGAQNAFVLRQGIRREHVAWVVAVCAIADAALISLGVFGLGAVIERAPLVLTVILWGGVAFLVAYAVMAFRRAFGAHALHPGDAARSSLRRTIVTCLSLTLLNPHVYLDTVVLMGTIAQAQGDGRWWFAVGGVVASLGWFSALGFGARMLAPVLSSPRAWRVLDVVIGVIMLIIAVRLAWTGLAGG